MRGTEEAAACAFTRKARCHARAGFAAPDTVFGWRPTRGSIRGGRSVAGGPSAWTRSYQIAGVSPEGLRHSSRAGMTDFSALDDVSGGRLPGRSWGPGSMRPAHGAHGQRGGRSGRLAGGITGRPDRRAADAHVKRGRHDPHASRRVMHGPVAAQVDSAAWCCSWWDCWWRPSTLWWISDGLGSCSGALPGKAGERLGVISRCVAGVAGHDEDSAHRRR